MGKGKDSFYAKYIKRILDIICSIFTLTIFCWLFAILAFLVLIYLGKPVIYKSKRIGKNKKEFTIYKFRSMTDKYDENGSLLPDIQRLTKFGRLLRASSLDELPEVWCILKGDMSLIGPRPLPVSYLPYYTKTEHHRHDVRPGLSGWAQVNGRNALNWDRKFEYDIEYVRNMSFIEDIKIFFLTAKKVLIHDGIGQGEEAPKSLYDVRSDMVSKFEK